MATTLTEISVNGELLVPTQTGTFAWTAANITLRLRNDLRWDARRGTTHTYGDTAQEALDNLITAEAKAARKAAKTAALTDGQRFAEAMRTYLHIGPRTRRYRNGGDLHREIANLTFELIFEGTEAGHREDLIAAAQPAFAAIRSYDQHITTGRIGGLVNLYVSRLSPWQLLNLLAEMVDGGVTHTGGGERWLQDFRRTLAYGEAGPTGYQEVLRLAA